MTRLQDPQSKRTPPLYLLFILFKSTSIFLQSQKLPEAIRKTPDARFFVFWFDPSFVTAAGSHRKLGFDVISARARVCVCVCVCVCVFVCEAVSLVLFMGLSRSWTAFDLLASPSRPWSKYPLGPRPY